MANKRSTYSFPKLELSNFSFSPPGPMGWSFSQYEKILEKPADILNSSLKRSTGFETLLEGQKIIEYPSNPAYKPVARVKSLNLKAEPEPELGLYTEPEPDDTDLPDESSIELIEQISDEESIEEVEEVRPKIKIRFIINDANTAAWIPSKLWR
ncbi:hypothetical protein CVD25_09170 [Bacillus canaveralius]|uniref:Uncharacterized protein n=1 Tax=Bacillus canaveralius TaxID=1403243 RepID=A0A2N5GKR0_9BACI|nr:hypothetical protein [Bacillus canaveralius]PLR82114.1 hypothetical protein CU635_13170 [Bacillus canaveralius]PLR97980.1 hypothetical protein CVD25_09170 [Bacillus canaveralius]